jgi:hypothetical protein
MRRVGSMLLVKEGILGIEGRIVGDVEWKKRNGQS